VAEARGASHASLSGRSAPALYPLPVDRLFPSGWMIDLWIGTVLAALVAGANAATQGHNVFARRYHRRRRRKIANIAKTAAETENTLTRPGVSASCTRRGVSKNQPDTASRFQRWLPASKKQLTSQEGSFYFPFPMLS